MSGINRIPRHKASLRRKVSVPWFNIKMSSYQYRKSHCGDETILRPSYLHNGISYTGKMTSLYWIRALDVMTPSCVSVMEVVTPEWRSLVMAIRYICWMSGILLNVAAAYVFRQWRTIFLVIGVPNIIHLILLPWVTISALGFSLMISERIP